MIAAAFALEFESAGFRAAQSRQLCVSIWTLGVTGQRSAAALERLIAVHRPRILVSAGFSGALQPGLGVGSIVIGENYTAPRILDLLNGLADLRIGAITTAPVILESSSAKKEWGERTGALAGDLETAHLYDVCRNSDIPMLSIRSISDTVDQDLPLPGDVLIDPESGRSDPARIFRHLFRHPSKAAKFARLVADAKEAQHALAHALGLIVPILLKGRF